MKISSGIRDLDTLIDSLYVGDNVVWEIEAGTSPEIFVLNFIRQSFSENAHVIYVSFNNSPNTILQKIGQITKKEHFVLVDCFTSGKGKNDQTFIKFYENNVDFDVLKVEDPKNIDNFTSILNSLQDRFQSKGRYIFDSLTGMQDLWGYENKTYKFFTYLCPRLYNLGTVAYWILEKDAHSQQFKANLRHITQVVLDLYKRNDKLWLKASKLEGRTSREAFKPHLYEIANGTISIKSARKEAFFDLGAKIKELRTKIGMTQKELADKVDLTPSFISQLESNQIIPSLHSFINICNALGVNFSYALEENQVAPPVIIKKEKIFSNPLFKESGVRGFNILKDEKVSAILMVIEPYAETKFNFLPSEGRKLIYILRGDISATINGRGKFLRSGDSVYIKTELLSYLRNEGGDSAEILLISL